MDQTLPNHLDYIVDFEGFSLIFRPMGNATEIVQYRRMTYSKDNLYLATEQILDHLPKAQEDDLFATRLLQSLIKTDQLVTCQGIDVRGTSLYWLIDGDTKEVFDPNTSRRDYQYSLARQKDLKPHFYDYRSYCCKVKKWGELIYQKNRWMLDVSMVILLE